MSLNVKDGGNSIPLISANLRATVTGLAVSLVLEQSFKNDSQTTPVEATFSFNQGGSTICGFSAEIGDRKLTGIIKTREQAFIHYDNAVASGQTAAIVEQNQDKEGCIDVSIGNLPPGQSCKVITEFIQSIVCEGDLTKLILPFIGEMIITKKDQATATTTTASSSLVFEGILIDINVIPSGTKIISLNSSSNPNGVCNILDNGKKANYHLEQEEWNCNGRPFSLEFKEENPHLPSMVIEFDEENASIASMFTFTPCFNEDQLLKGNSLEFVFVIDCSGSMSGSRIDQAKLALKLCIRGLPQGCLFNIISFGTSFNSLFQESQVYNEQTFASAEECISKMGGDLGGTNILDPLKHVINQPISGNRSRQIFVMTDGEVSNVTEVISLCETCKTARIFSFGISSECSVKLVEDIARITNGKCVLVKNSEGIPQQVMEQLSRAVQPSITNVQVNCNIPGIVLIPSRLPPIFNTESYFIFGITEQLIASIPENISTSLEGIDPSGKEIKINLQPTTILNDPTTTKTIHKLAIGSYIKLFKEDYSKKDKIIELALKYKLISPFTSFVVIDTTNTQATQSSMEKKKVLSYDDSISQFDTSFTSTASPPAIYPTTNGNSDQFAGFTYTPSPPDVQDPRFQQLIRNDQQIDQLLDRVACSVSSLKETANSINDEIQIQGQMLEELEEKVQTTQSSNSFVNSMKSAPTRFMNWIRSSNTSNTSSNNSQQQIAPSSPSSHNVTDNYDLISVIGQGACGKVMKVKAKGTGEVSVMKVTQAKKPGNNIDRTSTYCGTPEYMPPEVLSGKFTSCSGITMDQAKAINHPFILRLIDFSEKDGKCYSIHESTSYELPYLLVTQKKFPVEVVRFIIAQLVLVMEYLHKHKLSLGTQFGIDDLLIDKNGFLKVNSENFTLANKDAIKLDMYKLGCITFELLTGLSPFYSDNIQEIYKKIMSNQVPKLPLEFGTEERVLISNLLEGDPDNRPKYIQEIKDMSFFQHFNVDWDKFLKLQVNPPAFLTNPIASNHSTDTSQIDPSFTSFPTTIPAPPSTTSASSIQPQKLTRHEKFNQILLLCQSNGSWKSEKALLTLIGIENAKFPEIKSISDDIWVTALAISYLKIQFGDFSSEWKVVSEKTTKWLDNSLSTIPSPHPTITELLSQAESFLKTS